MRKSLLLLSIIILIFCRGGIEDENPTIHDEQGIKNKNNAHNHQELRISSDVQKEWGIVSRIVAKEKVSRVLTLPGVLTLNQNKTAHISSFVSGKVVSILADLGDRVKKGQPLLTLNSPEFAQAQASFLEAQAKLNLSRKEYERAKTLLKEKAIEEREYLKREAEYEKLATESGLKGSILHSYGMDHEETEKLIEKCSAMGWEGKLCELASPFLSIPSPLEGKIIFRDVIKGEHVEPQKILFTASDLSTLWGLLDAYEKDLPLIKKDSTVRIKSSIYPEKEFPAQISYISDIIDDKLRTIKIRVIVENKEELLKPNMYIEGVLKSLDTSQEFIILPEDAIQNLNEEKIVFVHKEEALFAIRHVEVGERVGERRIILKGLEGGERVVIKGAFTLKSELTKETFAHAHPH